jgi:hypothetical protein
LRFIPHLALLTLTDVGPTGGFRVDRQQVDHTHHMRIGSQKGGRGKMVWHTTIGGGPTKVAVDFSQPPAGKMR